MMSWQCHNYADGISDLCTSSVSAQKALTVAMAAKASSAMLEAAADRDRVWVVEREVTCGGEGERNELLFDLWQLSHENRP